MSSAPLEPRWPPRSPHEALLSSPIGRERARQYHDRTSPSPSPLKRQTASPNVRGGKRRLRPKEHIGNEEEDEEEEDEETLQLRLQALEAKLKLKKLQHKRKAASSQNSDVEKDGRPDGRSAAKENRPPSVEAQAQTSRTVGFEGQSSRVVQIPASPQKSMRAQDNVHSPKKVLLGIDKGLTGRNVSLKRAPSNRSQGGDPFQTTEPSKQISGSMSLSRKSQWPLVDASEKPKMSFSERIAQSRQEDARRHEHANRVRKQQSTGFGVAQDDIANAKRKANQMDAESKSTALARPSEFSRDEILKASSKADLGVMRRSNTVSSISRSQRIRSPTKTPDIWMNPNAEPELPKQSRSVSTSHKRARSESPPPRDPVDHASHPPNAPSTSDPLFESFSSLHLSNRHLSHDLLTKTFSSKSILRLPDLLRSVKSPHYGLPDDLEADYVVLAIVASKSSPLTHKDKSTNAKTTSTSTPTSISEAASSSQNNNGKYMVLTLTDLKWSLDLYLFSTGYTRFWKLTPGTLIALLNPSIMPPPPNKKDTGRFSLTLNSSDDTVLEIGRARDLAWCSSVRKDGKPCDTWVDKRHTSVCEYHVDRVVERTRSARMEVSGMSAPFAPGGRKNGRTGFFSSGSGGGDSRKTNAARKGGTDGFARADGSQYDRSSRSTFFMAAPGSGRSTAQLLDADHFQLDRSGGTQAERTRKRLADREREGEIARKLGRGGKGVGGEYLRLRRGKEDRDGNGRGKGDGGDEDADEGEGAGEGMEKPTVMGLGLKRVASEAQLSPLRKKKKVQGLREVCPRKKTRFVTEKGIRVAGRDSLGVVLADEEEEDEDELEVI